MHGVIELFGWFVFNVAIPLFAPLALLSLVSVADFYSAHRRGILRYAVKDGQLYWVAIPMNATACYVLASVVEHAGVLRQLVWIPITGHAVLIVVASVLVLFATMDAHLADSLMQRRESRIPWPWVFLVGFSATIYFLGYIYLIRPVTSACLYFP